MSTITRYALEKLQAVLGLLNQSIDLWLVQFYDVTKRVTAINRC